MSSQLKVNSIRDTSNNEALSISSGNVSFNNTISAGTLGLNVSHTVGWQHIKSFHHTSSSSATNNILFDNVFSSDYTAYLLHIGWLNSSLAHPIDLHFRYRSGGASGVDHADTNYKGVNAEYSHATGSSDTFKNTIHNTAVNKATLVDSAYSNNNTSYGVMGFIHIYNANSPTVLGTSTDRGTVYLPHLRGTLLHYHSQFADAPEQWGYTENYWNFTASHNSSDYTGFKLFMTKYNDHDEAANVKEDSYMTLFGLKSQATA